MRSCSLRKIWTALSALLLVLSLMSPLSAHAASAAIGTATDLQAALDNIADGGEIPVGDIDFSALKDPIVISKSVTLRSGKEQGPATFFDGSFVIDGSSGKISVQLDNIIFYSTGDASSIPESFWEQDEVLPSAVTFRGDVDALLTACVFRNYVSLSGANLIADYAETDAKLNIQASDCSFLGNAVRDRGGAVMLSGQKETDNIVFTAENCAFNGNLSGNGDSALGGGAIYADAAALKLTGCSFSANEASHQYLLPEPEEGGQETDTAFADHPDRTRGGAIYAVESSLSMTDCVVTQCSASLGGGLALENCDLVFLNGIIAHNRAESSLVQEGLEGLKAEAGMGGGLFISADRAVMTDIINSSLYGNSALNAYGGICIDGAGSNELPFAVRMMLCTCADNKVDTAYSMPEIDRSQFIPEEPEEEPAEEPEESESSEVPEDPDSEKTEEEKAREAEEAAKKAAEEAAKKAEEAQKAAEEAYQKALADKLAEIEWKEVPGDIWAAPFLEVKASVVIDEIFSVLGHNKLAYERHTMPDAESGFTYYAAPEIARTDGYMPNIPSAVFTHVIPGDAFREAFPLPAGMAEEILSPYFDKVLGNFAAGDNNGGSLTYQLLMDNLVWKTVEAEKTTPELPVPEKEGHSFDLWQTSDGKAYEAGESFITAVQPLTLQVNAVMHPNTYTLHFVSETGTQDVKQVYGTPVTLPAASEKKNYEFVSWYKSDGTAAMDGEIYTRLGDSTYTAQYTKQFPMTLVIILSAAIVLIALYLIIARIAEHRKKTMPEREAKKAEKAAQKEAQEKAKAEAQARKVQEKAKQKASELARREAEKAAKAEAKAEEAVKAGAETVKAAEEAAADTGDSITNAANKIAEAIAETADEAAAPPKLEE